MLTGRTSISLRLTFWFGGIFIAGWLLFSATMWLNLKGSLTEERNLTLSRRIDRLEVLLENTHKEPPAQQFLDFKEFAHATGRGLIEIVRPDGARVYPWPSATANSFPWPTDWRRSKETFVEVHENDRPYWVLVRPFSLDGNPVYLLAAAPEAGNLLFLKRFQDCLIASAPILLLVSCAGGYWLSRRALKPVGSIAATARSISIRNLSERLPVSRTGDELDRLAETCNAMLERLECAVKQIKQFTADASHELRGPLSFIRTVAEVAERNPKADSASRQAFVDIVDETAIAAVLLEDMLTLARADAESGEAILRPLDLTAVVEEACDMARPLATERSLRLSATVDGSDRIRVLGDFSMLRRLVWILLDNALKYTPSPGHIDVALRATSEKATVEVRDSGAGIAQTDLPHIFDRFYRADPSRSQIEGSGLGLSIAKWIAEIHRADLTVSSEELKGTTVQLVLPVSLKPEAIA